MAIQQRDSHLVRSRSKTAFSMSERRGSQKISQDGLRRLASAKLPAEVLYAFSVFLPEQYQLTSIQNRDTRAMRACLDYIFHLESISPNNRQQVRRESAPHYREDVRRQLRNHLPETAYARRGLVKTNVFPSASFEHTIMLVARDYILDMLSNRTESDTSHTQEQVMQDAPAVIVSRPPSEQYRSPGNSSTFDQEANSRSGSRPRSRSPSSDFGALGRSPRFEEKSIRPLMPPILFRPTLQADRPNLPDDVRQHLSEYEAVFKMQENVNSILKNDVDESRRIISELRAQLAEANRNDTKMDDNSDVAEHYQSIYGDKLNRSNIKIGELRKDIDSLLEDVTALRSCLMVYGLRSNEVDLLVSKVRSGIGAREALSDVLGGR